VGYRALRRATAFALTQNPQLETHNWIKTAFAFAFLSVIA
jgi:hypothetical protein